MAANSGLRLQQRQSMAQEMRLNQFQQQSLHFLQSGVVKLLSEIEELRTRYPELRWKNETPGEWEQGNVELNKRKRYPGEWRLENQWLNGRFLSVEDLAKNSDSKQQMLENYTGGDDGPELREVLREQIYLWKLQEEEKEFCEFVLQNLDERGLNYENPIFIASSLLPRNSAEKKKLAELLQRIQELEPIGCACDSPLQSLVIQARFRFPGTNLCRVLQSLPSLEILGGLEDFVAYLHKQGLDDEEGQCVLQDLRELEPYPARGYRVANGLQNFRIYPEIQVVADKATGSIEVELLNNLGAKLQIVAPNGQENFKQYHRREEAALLLQQLQRREETLLRIAQSIFRQQRQFVIGGVKDLQMLTLQMVADDIHLHISTISRCLQSKYCKTPWGTYPLRFFFSQGAQSGQSREQVKERMVGIVQEYALSLSIGKPGTGKIKLSDTEMGKRLNKLDIQIARRTVAKYRAELLSEGRL